MAQGLKMSDFNENGRGILNSIFSEYGLKPVIANSYSPLSLAYIGDSVYGLVVKSVVTLKGNCPANQLNKMTTNYVKAVSQAKIADYYTSNDILSEEEANIMRRGRNAKSATTAKNASVSEYRAATGLEALMGYLYLKGETDRMTELIRAGMDFIDSVKK